MAAYSHDRYVALDSLRGISALMVALYHCAIAPMSHLPILKNSYLFVDFFFVLSGFVIATSYGDRLSSGYRV